MNPLTLSLRIPPVGGEVNLSPNLTDIKTLRSKSSLTLLVHGYNNNLAQAQDSFSAFLDIQCELFGVSQISDLPADRDFVQVFWPGDGWGWLGPLYYSEALQHAELAAPVLADALEEIARFSGIILTVEFIGHSLGCRLILETIKRLEHSSVVSIGRVALMAAAVPVEFLEDARHSPTLVDEFQALCEHGALSLYSPADRVLAGAFPAGETISANEHCWLPVALGHDQWQISQPHDRFEQDTVNGADHSDYWGQQKATRDTCAVVAGEKVRNFLQLPTGTRQLLNRNQPGRTPDERGISDRVVGIRDIASRAT